MEGTQERNRNVEAYDESSQYEERLAELKVEHDEISREMDKAWEDYTTTDPEKRITAEEFNARMEELTQRLEKNVGETISVEEKMNGAETGTATSASNEEGHEDISDSSESEDHETVYASFGAEDHATPDFSYGMAGIEHIGTPHTDLAHFIAQAVTHIL